MDYYEGIKREDCGKILLGEKVKGIQHACIYLQTNMRTHTHTCTCVRKIPLHKEWILLLRSRDPGDKGGRLSIQCKPFTRFEV